MVGARLSSSQAHTIISTDGEACILGALSFVGDVICFCGHAGVCVGFCFGLVDGGWVDQDLGPIE